jgi:hypothetical protein
MMSQQFQQPAPPNRSNTMKDVGWPIILISATVLGSIIGAIILGTTHFIGFNWLLLIWGCIMLGMTFFFAWYSIRTRQKLQEQYNKDIADIKSDVLTFKNDYRQMREDETRHWNDWAVSFSQASAKEQKERLEEVRNNYQKEIQDSKAELLTIIDSYSKNFSNWAIDHANGHGREQKEFKRQLDALEQKPKGK